MGMEAKFYSAKSNIEYRKAKIHGNQQRDKNAIIMLLQVRWNVITIWECSLTATLFLGTIDKIATAITLQYHNNRQTFVEA